MNEKDVEQPYMGCYLGTSYWYTWYNMDETQTSFVEWKKRDTKYYILYDSIYMQGPKKENLQRQKADSGCQGLGMGAEIEIMVAQHFKFTKNHWIIYNRWILWYAS